MDSLKIGHYNYDVKVIDGLQFGDDYVNGLCLPDSKEILLSDKLNNKYHKGVLIHEVVHGLFSESGLSDRLEDGLEEDFAILLGNALHGFLENNIDKLHQLYKK
jgi:hypothetical protein